MNIKIRTSQNPETTQQALSIITENNSLLFMDGETCEEGTIHNNFSDLLLIPSVMLECYEAGTLGVSEMNIEISELEWNSFIDYLNQYYG